MSDIVKLAATLAVISIVAGTAISFTNLKTADAIAEQKSRAETEAVQSVLPVNSTINALELDKETYWSATQNGNLLGYAFKGATRGFSGDIEFIAGVDTSGTIIGLAILSQTETPGLGTRIQEIVSTRYFFTGLFKKAEVGTPWFTQQFNGITIKQDIGIDKSGEWHTKSAEDKKALLERNEITALTGATISTRAVVTGIKKICGEKIAQLAPIPAPKPAPAIEEPESVIDSLPEEEVF